MKHNQCIQLSKQLLPLALVCGVVFISPHSVSAADRTIESGNYIIDMKKMYREGDRSNGIEAGEAYSITATDRIKHTSVTVKAEPLVELLFDVQVVAESKLLLRTFRKLHYLKEINSLYDLRTGKKMGGWLGLESSLSPSGRYLANITTYPRLDPSPYCRSILLICDFEKDIAEYTPGYVEKLPHSETMCGVPAFPERNAYERSYDILLDDEYLIQTDLLWSKDEKTLVFFATNVNEREFYLVRVDIANGVDHPQIAKKRIDVDAYIDYNKVPSVLVEDIKKRLPCLYNDRLWWSGENRVTLKAYEHTYYYNEEMEFTIPALPEQLIASIPEEATLSITATERQLILWPTQEEIEKHATCRDRSEEIPNVYRNSDRKSKPIKYGARDPQAALRDAECWILKVVKPEWIVEDLNNSLSPIQAEDASKSSMLCRWEIEGSKIQVTQTLFSMWVVIQPAKVKVSNSSAEEFISSVLDEYLIHGDDMTSVELKPLDITSEKDISLFVMNRDGSKTFPLGASGNWWGNWKLVYTDKAAVAMLFPKIDRNSMASFGPDTPWF